MYRSFYSALYYSLLPLILLRMLWRSIKAPDYRQRMLERLAIFTLPKFAWGRRDKPIVLHTVSVGETIAALPLAKRLLEQYKTSPLIMTSMTPTGSRRIKEGLHKEIQQGLVFHVYLPYDLPIFVRKFLNKIDPKLFLIMETELWPNLLHFCAQRDIPTVLINARMSKKSASSYEYVKTLTEKMLADLTQVIAQSEKDGQRFIDLGLSPEKLTSVGNLKFDVDIDEDKRNQAKAYRELWQARTQRKVLLAASTHEGEEEIVLDAFAQFLINNNFSESPVLVLVPRHPERFQEIQKLAEQKFNVRCVSEDLADENTQVIIGDVMGKLNIFYGAADVAFVGGSLFARGGHNILEAAAWGTPILTGTSMFNFQVIADTFAEHHGLLYVKDARSLSAAFQRVLLDKNLYQQMSQIALALFNDNGGALEKTLDTLACIVKP